MIFRDDLRSKKASQNYVGAEPNLILHATSHDLRLRLGADRRSLFFRDSLERRPELESGHFKPASYVSF
jgi:hypothetical protein